MDFKLLCLKMVKKAGMILTATVVGAVFCGGIFHMKATVFSPDTAYEVTGETYIDYIPEEAYGISRVYITDEVWKALVKSDAFVESMQQTLSLQGYVLSEEEITGSVEAAVVSDSRIVTTTVHASEEELAVTLSSALQKAILEFCTDRQEIAESFVMTAPREAQRKVWDLRTVTATLLGAVLGFAAAVAGCLLSFGMDDSIYLPGTFEKRYGLPVFGTLQAEELAANGRKFTLKDRHLLVIGTAEEAAAEEAAKKLEEKLKKAGGGAVRFEPAGKADFTPERVEQMKEADGVVLAVSCGRRDGRQIERIINFLQKQEICIKGAVLCGADEKLVARYYAPGVFKKGRAGKKTEGKA